MTREQIIKVEDSAVNLYQQIFDLILTTPRHSHTELDLTSIMIKVYEIIQDLSEYRRTYTD